LKNKKGVTASCNPLTRVHAIAAGPTGGFKAAALPQGRVRQRLPVKKEFLYTELPGGASQNRRKRDEKSAAALCLPGLSRPHARPQRKVFHLAPKKAGILPAPSYVSRQNRHTYDGRLVIGMTTTP